MKFKGKIDFPTIQGHGVLLGQVRSKKESKMRIDPVALPDWGTIKLKGEINFK